MKEIRTECIKERRAANAKLLMISPFVFSLFNGLMRLLMPQSPEGRSYLLANSFNWYPILILPVILSLLVINIKGKEKKNHRVFQKTLGLDGKKIMLGKNIVVVGELLIILLISSTLIYLMGKVILGEFIEIKTLVSATIFLYTASLPVIGVSFILYDLFHKKFLIILGNFILMFLGPIIAVSKYWVLFPWSYSLRILAPVVGVHPNGTFLSVDSPLMNWNMTYLGFILSIGVYFLSVGIQILMERREKMTNVLYSQWLRTKRTSVRLLLLVCPILYSLLYLVYVLGSKTFEGSEITSFFGLFSFLSGFCLSFFIPMIYGPDREAGFYANELRSGIGRTRNLLSKFLLISLLFLFIELASSLIFLLGLSIFSEVKMDPSTIFTLMAIPFLCLLPMCGLSVFTLKFGYSASVFLGCFSSLSSVLLGTTDLGALVWKYLPFTWNIRLIYLYGKSDLAIEEVYTWLVLAFFLGLVLLSFLCLWYNKWDGTTKMEE